MRFLMVAGRPRTVSPDPEKCVELGKDLVNWATEPTEEWRCLLGQWWSLKQKMIRNDWNSLKQAPEFLPYYEQAQQALAVKAVNGTMEKSFGQRYIRLYDRELVDAENEKAKFDAALKKEAEQTQPKEIVFKVQYPNESSNRIEILSEAVSTTNSECPQ